MKNNNKELIITEPWIDTNGWKSSDFNDIKTPVYVISLNHLEKNLELISNIEKDTGVKILMALKSFSLYKSFPLIKKYLSGTEASSVYEARLGKEEFGGEVHVFSPSFTENNLKEYVKYADHIVCNSFNQLKLVRKFLGKNKKISVGIRVNLEHSESSIEKYDPSRKNSHFGVTDKEFKVNKLDGIEGIHFHNLCESNADAFVRSLDVFVKKFGKYLLKMKWVNFGGGHHLTRSDYNVALLKETILNFKKKYPHLRIYLEPGEAIALNAGVLVGQVIDIIKKEKNIAVLDISATCHMPDVLEMPYKPTILNGITNLTKKDKNIYQLVGPSCLTGDVIGSYAFDKKLKVGDRIIFMNMAIYTMVKNNTFNGINLPDIAILKNKKIKVIKSFNYNDFKNRLS